MTFVYNNSLLLYHFHVPDLLDKIFHQRKNDWVLKIYSIHNAVLHCKLQPDYILYHLHMQTRCCV